MKNKTNLFLLGSIIIIILAIALVAIINKNAPSGPATDVRARAGNQNTLKLTGVITSADEGKGSLTATNVQFAASDRAGKVQNLGEWIITAPAGFNLAAASPGSIITVGVDASTFDVTNHTVNAVTLTVRK